VTSEHQGARRAGVARLLGLNAGRLARVARRGDGVQIAGRVMLRVAPSIGHELATGRRIALISATNGKTSTTAMLAAAVRDATHRTVAHNASGANLMPGLVEALAAATDATDAVLETDEGALVHAIAELDPDVIVLGELSRDQLDRYHEVRGLAARWQAALRGTRATVVAVANDPNVAWAVEDVPDVRWVDIEAPARLDSSSCPACANLLDRSSGAWRCPACGRAQTEAPTTVQRGNHVTVAGETLTVELGLRGRWQYANAALALTAANVLGLDLPAALAAMATVREVAGRPTRITIAGDREAETVLVKNPAGWAALVAELAARPPDVAVVVAQNDRIADGTDPSFLWDVPFEAFAGRTVAAAGTRAFDAAARLDVAGANVVAVDPDPRRAAAQLPAGGPTVIAASYTSFYETVRNNKRHPKPSASFDFDNRSQTTHTRPGASRRESEVTIGLLFPDLLGTYGDRGNATVLRSRLLRRGIAGRIVEVDPDEPIPASLDIYLLGGGEDHAEIVALDRLERSPLRDAWTRGAAVVGVCAGLQLLGTRLELEGEPRDGLGFFTATTQPGPARCVGEVVLDACDAALGAITGFENHQGVTVVGDADQPLGRHADGRAEGVLGERLVGTYLHGPVLVRNPRLADRVLTWVTGPLAPLADGFESALHDARVDASRGKVRNRRG
jgi:CobQ-like glutamine amidotransferase family enzyme/UDP-N-acetylmuramyl tripeptide synthase